MTNRCIPIDIIRLKPYFHRKSVTLDVILHIASFLKLLLFAQLNETESLRAISDKLLSEDLQKARK